jgi:hypothetical protein
MAVKACGDRSRGFCGVLVMHSGRVRVGVARERSGDRQFQLQNHLGGARLSCSRLHDRGQPFFDAGWLEFRNRGAGCVAPVLTYLAEDAGVGPWS